MSTLLRALAQVLLALSCYLTLVGWIDWLTARPIAELPLTGFFVDAPARALSFTMVHGQPYFRERGSAAEEPLGFGLLTLVLLANAAVLYFSFPASWRRPRG